jgi:PPM family protein phosphatase
LLSERQLGSPVRCHKCGQSFTPQPLAQHDQAYTEPIPATAGRLRLGIAGVTSTGQKRTRNEDSFLIQHLTWFDANDNYQLGLVIVADGLGGHASGETAAAVAIRTVGGALAPLLSEGLRGGFTDITRKKLADSIEIAIKDANRAVQQLAATNPRLKGMGATAAVTLIWNGRVVIGHVGDCRVYHFHAGELQQVSKDQTVVARMVELGQLSPDEALTHPARNQVNQAIGTRANIEPASYKLKLVSGDWLLVACDGLHSQVKDDTIQTTLRKAPPSAYLVASRLVDLANQSGGTDNCTVVAVRCY